MTVEVKVDQEDLDEVVERIFAELDTVDTALEDMLADIKALSDRIEELEGGLVPLPQPEPEPQPEPLPEPQPDLLQKAPAVVGNPSIGWKVPYNAKITPVFVNNREDSGEGSWRYAISRDDIPADHYRAVIFTKSGRYTVGSELIHKDNTLLFGQYAPGTVELWGNRASFRGANIFGQHIRFAGGYGADNDTVQFIDVRNAVLQNCTMINSDDECVSWEGRKRDCLNAYLIDCLAGYPVRGRDHNFGFYFLDNTYGVGVLRTVASGFRRRMTGQENPSRAYIASNLFVAPSETFVTARPVHDEAKSYKTPKFIQLDMYGNTYIWVDSKGEKIDTLIDFRNDRGVESEVFQKRNFIYHKFGELTGAAKDPIGSEIRDTISQNCTELLIENAVFDDFYAFLKQHAGARPSERPEIEENIFKEIENGFVPVRTKPVDSAPVEADRLPLLPEGFAEDGRSRLLIDADLRHQTLDGIGRWDA